jgi:putative DNA primase/helicase
MDDQMYVSIGESATDTDWKRKKVTFGWFIDELSKPKKVTNETYSQFMAWDTSKQAKLKDIGGYMPGELSSGNRKNANVMNRCMVALDADTADPDLWRIISKRFPDWNVIMHSTRKHHPDSPRFRILFPFDRPVTRDEFMPISLWIANELGMEQFDDSTHQLERLMYWPSVSRDMVDDYVFKFWDKGEAIDPDWVLDQYQDWRDVSQWPMTERMRAKIHDRVKQLGDPSLKPHPVGPFCECYDIEQVIEKYLSDVYEIDEGSLEYGMNPRYTYVDGTSAKGAVSYNGWHLYSHHASDPAFEQACNSYDLVRIHKFGDLDKGAKPGTPVNKLPSEREMRKFVDEDVEVKRMIGMKHAGLLKQFSPMLRTDDKVVNVKDVESSQDDTGSYDSYSVVEGKEGNGGEGERALKQGSAWYGELDMEKGEYQPSAKNYRLVLENHPGLAGRIRYNVFKERMEVWGGFPWDERIDKRNWAPDDLQLLYQYMGESQFELPRTDKLKDAVIWVKNKNRYHPIHDYLKGLKWDGKKRLDWAVIDCLGAEDTEYVRTVTRKWMIAAVKRIMEPGCKFDNVLALVGGEGKGKSTFFKNLGRREWFTDQFRFSQLTGGNGKQAFETTQGAWIVEIPEMAGLSRSTAEEIKAFLGAEIDTFRPSHAAEVVDRLRCFVFGASSNYDAMLDSTSGGNRRFWPVDIDTQEPSINVFTEMAGEYVDQLWAEAMMAYIKGEFVFLSDRMKVVAKQQQIEHESQSGYEMIISRYLEMEFPENWSEMDLATRQRFVRYEEKTGVKKLKNVCIEQLWEEGLGYDSRELTKAKRNEISGVMRKMRAWEYGSRPLVCGAYGEKRGFKRTHN